MGCSVWVVWTGWEGSKEAMRVLLKSPCQIGRLSYGHAKAVHNCRSSHVFLTGRCSKFLTPAIRSMVVSCISYPEDRESLEYSEDPIDGTTHEWLLCGWDIPDGTRNHSCIQATFYRWQFRVDGIVDSADTLSHSPSPDCDILVSMKVAQQVVAKLILGIAVNDIMCLPVQELQLQKATLQMLMTRSRKARGASHQGPKGEASTIGSK